MQEAIQIFIGSNGLDLPDFYPDDLPKEWRFDYYENNNDALMLGFDTEVDLEEALEEVDEDFKLVINITNAQNIDSLLKSITKYKDNFVLYSENDNFIDNIQLYNFCIKSNNEIKNCENIDGFCFNNYLVKIEEMPENEIEVKEIIKAYLKYEKNVILIFKNIDEEGLHNARIISQLLIHI